MPSDVRAHTAFLFSAASPLPPRQSQCCSVGSSRCVLLRASAAVCYQGQRHRHRVLGTRRGWQCARRHAGAGSRVRKVVAQEHAHPWHARAACWPQGMVSRWGRDVYHAAPGCAHMHMHTVPPCAASSMHAMAGHECITACIRASQRTVLTPQ